MDGFSSSGSPGNVIVQTIHRDVSVMKGIVFLLPEKTIAAGEKMAVLKKSFRFADFLILSSFV